MRKLFAILTMLAALMLASVTAFAAPSLVVSLQRKCLPYATLGRYCVDSSTNH